MLFANTLTLESDEPAEDVEEIENPSTGTVKGKDNELGEDDEGVDVNLAEEQLDDDEEY